MKSSKTSLTDIHLGIGVQSNILYEIEMAALGAVIFASKIPEAFKSITHEMFCDTTLGTVWQAIEFLDKKKQSCDYITISELLRKHNRLDQVGGVIFISSLGNIAVATHRQADFAFMIKKAYIQRTGINLLYEGINEIKTNDDHPLPITKGIVQKLEALENNTFVQLDNNDARHYADKVKDRIENIRAGKIIPFLSTGFLQIDKAHNGLYKADVIVVAARPGMGKTAFAVSVAKNVAQAGHPVLIFSLEMSGESIVERFVSAIGNINGQKMKNPVLMTTVEEYNYRVALEEFSQLPIHIEDNASITVQMMREKTGRLVRKLGIQFVIIDYIQLLGSSTKQGNREQEISEISREIKLMAKENSIPVLALAQLSRAVESRADKTPKLSDLRESGSIEQDADIVAFLMRPEYYHIYKDENGEILKGILKYIIAKNRHGAVLNLYLKFIALTASVIDSDRKEIDIQSTEDPPF